MSTILYTCTLYMHLNLKTNEKNRIEKVFFSRSDFDIHPLSCLSMILDTKVKDEVIVVLTTVELRQAICVIGSATRRPKVQAIINGECICIDKISPLETSVFCFYKFHSV